MNKVLLLVVGVMLTLSLSAQKSKIRAQAVSYIGQNGSVLVTDEFISGRRTVVADFEVSETGGIDIELEFDEARVIDLQIGGTYGTLIVEPGETYEFSFPEVSGKKARTLSANKVELEFARDARNLNAWIARYNTQYDNYFSLHAPDIAMSQYSGSSGYTRSRRSQLASTGLIPERIFTFKLDVPDSQRTKSLCFLELITLLVD